MGNPDPRLRPIADPFLKPIADPFAPKLRPIDYDPFKLKPVDHDPFAPKSSVVGSAARGAGGQALPAAAGAAAFGPGAAAGAIAVSPIATFTGPGAPIVEGIGALGGGLLAAFGAGHVVKKVQDKVLSLLPGVRSALGQDPEQIAADEEQHPNARFAGELASNLPFMRPGFARTALAADAPRITKMLAHPAGGAAVGGTLGAATEGVNQASQGDLDPGRLGLAAVFGAAMNRPTTLGDALFTRGANATAIGIQRGVAATGRAYRGTAEVGARFVQARRDAGDIASGSLIENPPQDSIALPPAKALPAPSVAKAAPIEPVLRPVEGDPFAAPAGHRLIPIDDPFASPTTRPADVSSILPSALSSEVGPSTDPLRPDPGDLADGEHYVTTPAGNRIRSRFEVVDTRDLQGATGDLQNRDRSRDSTDLQVTDIVSNFDPSRLGASAETDRGAPIVGADGVVESGNGRMLAINRIYDATKRSVENLADKTLGDVTSASYDAPVHPETGGQRLSLLPDEISALRNHGIAIDDNGNIADTEIEKLQSERARRVRGGKRVEPDQSLSAKAGDYRSYIESQGHSTEGIERPVLIRRRATELTPEQRRQFVIDSNKDAKLAMTSVERARSDADGLDGDTLALYRGGDVSSAGNAEFVSSFNKRLTPGEIASQIDAAGQTSQDGITRIENALMARAYENPAVLSKLIEARDNNIRSIGAGMLDNAGQWAKLRADVKEGRVHPEFDATDKLVEAARRVSDIRANGMKISDALAQADAFNQIDPMVEQFMRAFYNPALTRAASRESISSAIQTYARRAAEQTTDARLFGGDDTTPAEIMQGILDGQSDSGTGDMFAVAADAPADTPLLGDVMERRLGDRRALREHRSPEILPPARAAASLPDDLIGDSETPDYSAGRPSIHHDTSPYDPNFATRSFTDRTSIFNSAAEAMGIDPEKFTLMPAPRQVSLLRDAIQAKFGVEVIVDRGMQERFAIDQMLDAFQNVQGMAHVLDLPNKAISLGGALKLKLQKGGKFLGAFQPGANLIMLPKRSNSFAHEWAHALDYHLMDRLSDDVGRGLTGAVRRNGNGIMMPPETVRDALTDLLNAMFFDKAGAATKIMRLEAKIATTESAKVKASAEAELARLRDGSSQARDIRSAFYKGAQSLDKGGEYWTSPTEMFARAFEAYVSYKVEAAGLTTEFIGKGDAGYLSDAEERFAKSFPKGEERAEIFAAMEALMGNLADEQMLGKGIGAEKPGGTVRRMTDYDKTPKVAKERGVIRREITAIKRAILQRKKEIANRPDNAKGVMEKLADLNGVTFMSMTGNLRMIQGRSGSASLQKLIDLLTKQDGKGDRTVARTFAEDVHIQKNIAINRLSNILKSHGVESRTAAQDMLLRDLLIGAREDGPANYVKAAAAIRHLLDNEFYVNQKAGIDLGYTRNGYLARVLDMPKVYGDQPGFVRDATKVYEIVFDKEFGDDHVALLGDDEKFPAFIKMARVLAKTHGLPSLAPFLKAYKQMRKLDAQTKNSDDPDAILAKMAALQPDLEDLFGELVDEARPAYASERADAWLAKINLVAGQEHNAASPDSKYTKHRELPPEADKLMEKYYLSDPVESVTNYLTTSARRTSYARRFGADSKKRMELFEGMAAEGVSPDDQRTVARILDTATGRMRSELPAIAQQTLSFVNAAGTMALLPRATLSSLAEPFTSGLVTGSAASGFDMMGKQISAALGAPSGAVRGELARAMGIVSDATSDNIMDARYGQTYADQTRWDRYTTAMFQRTGLTALTRAQKVAGVGLGHAFLDNLAQQIAKGGKAKDGAIAMMRELGIREPEAFAKELLATGRMPTVEELESDYGYDYSTAQLRFSKLVVQEPDAMDRPELASNPAGRVIYGITGFSYSYWRNIVKRNGILLNEIRKGQGNGKAALYGSGLFAAAAVAYLVSTTISTIRERLLNPKRWNELESKGELESTMLALGFTRTFALGAADMPIQAYTGLKYQRDLSNAFVGAGPSFFLQNAQKMAQIGVANSRKTNTAEYNATQGAYSAASPFIAFGLARLPGGPLIEGATGAGMAYATSPSARDAVATGIWGPKNQSVVDGKKVKSGPTVLDRTLDGVFGKVEKKKAASP